MPALPSSASMTGAAITEGDFKSRLSELLGFLLDLLGSDGTIPTAQAALGVVLGAGQLTKTTAYTVTTADRGKIIDCAGTFTVVLPAVATAGPGFAVAISNSGGGTITIDPASSELIDNAATKTVAPGVMCMVAVANGKWFSVGGVTLPIASTGQAGIVQLADTYGSSSTTLAATANAVYQAYVALNAAKAAVSHSHAYVPTDCGHGNVGSMVFAKADGSGVVVEGTTMPGTSLRCSDGTGQATGGILSGTWRALGRTISGGGSSTLFQRIA